MKSETILRTLGYKKYQLDDKSSYFKSDSTSKETFSIDIINGKIEHYNHWVENEIMNISDVNQRLKFPYYKVQPYGKWELSVIFEMPINDP